MRFGYVLAGGRSLRFGSDKAVYELAGLAMLAGALRLLEHCGLEARAVSPFDRAAHPSSVAEPWREIRHPLLGAAAALDHARARGATWALVCPCDLPELDAATLSALLSAPYPCHAPGQPLLTVLPVAAAGLAEALGLASAPVRRLHEALGSLALPGARPANLNVPNRRRP